MIKFLTVCYNTPDILLRMVSSLRQFHNNELLIIDGSNKYNYDKTKDLLNRFDNYEIHHFNYNVHHGPGLAYAFTIMDCSQIMVLDSDVIIYKGFLDILENLLRETDYGIGDVQLVNRAGWNIGGYERSIKQSDYKLGVAYLHPAFMLINREIALQWPLPIKHGAPMITPMIAITDAGKTDILQHCEFVFDDFRNEPKQFLRHDFQGTVKATNGYHLD